MLMLAATTSCPAVSLIPKADVAFIFSPATIAEVATDKNPPVPPNAFSVIYGVHYGPHVAFRLQNIPGSELKCLSLGMIHTDVFFSPVVHIAPGYPVESCAYTEISKLATASIQRANQALLPYAEKAAAGVDNLSAASPFRTLQI